MLIQRIITASILAALVAFAIFKLSATYFSVILAAVTFIGAWEWTNLAGFKVLRKKILFFVGLVTPMLLLHYWTQILELCAAMSDIAEIRDYSGILDWLLLPAIFFWILVMLLIRNAPAGLLNLQLKDSRKMLIGWGVLLAAWLFLSRLRAFYPAEVTMYFFVLIWVADIAAYFTGKKFGTTKLSPEISPGKTVAGMYGALLGSVLCAVSFSLLFKFPMIVASDFVLLSALTVLISIYGDLFFSLAKRIRGVKDSGVLLPGHGGVLDRIDSVIAAAPVFYAGIFFIYWSLI